MYKVMLPIDQIRTDILVNKTLTYSRAARITGLNKGEIWRAVNQNIYPRANWKRERIGLPLIQPVEICITCGEAHLKACPKARKPRKPEPPIRKAVWQAFITEMLSDRGSAIITTADIKEVIETKGFRLTRYNRKAK